MSNPTVETRPASVERPLRVSTLELFFDLVFVFTITQLTHLLGSHGIVGAAEVAVMFAVIWWMYDGYAWLTNTTATGPARHRILLIGGMGGFLIIALAIPGAYETDGLTFAVGYLIVTVVHAGMYVRGTSLSEVKAILRIVPFNIAAAGLVLLGGAIGGSAQWVFWILAAVLVWITPWFTSTRGFVISASHFVERHGLVVIVALGESVVVIGAGAASLEIDATLLGVALLSLALSAALWWLYFGEEGEVEHALRAAPPDQRPALALAAFGYWHYGILLGVVAAAAGLEKAMAAPFAPLDTMSAIELAAGVALFATCDFGFRSALAIEKPYGRLGASAAALLTAPVGTRLGAAAQVAALVTVLTATLLLRRWSSSASPSTEVAPGRADGAQGPDTPDETVPVPFGPRPHEPP